MMERIMSRKVQLVFAVVPFMSEYSQLRVILSSALFLRYTLIARYIHTDNP